MKIKIFALGIISLALFSCNKNSKTEETAAKNSDSIKILSNDTLPVTKTDSLSPSSSEAKPTIINYSLIKQSKQNPGAINKADLEKLSEPLKALAAFYSGLGGTNCDGENCDLTTALGLGKQGSDAHKNIIQRWFPNNKAAEQLISQNFYQPPNSSSNFSDYQFLDFEQQGDTVTVKYNLLVYSHGKSTIMKGPDKYIIEGNSIETLNRNIWKDVK